MYSDPSVLCYTGVSVGFRSSVVQWLNSSVNLWQQNVSVHFVSMCHIDTSCMLTFQTTHCVALLEQVTDPHLFLVSTVATIAQSWSADTKQMQRLWPRHYSNIVVPCARQASKAAHCARHPTDTRKQEETGVLHLDVLFAMYRIKIKTALVAARDKGLLSFCMQLPMQTSCIGNALTGLIYV